MTRFMVLFLALALILPQASKAAPLSSNNDSSKTVELVLQSKLSSAIDFNTLNNQARHNIEFINNRVSVSGHWLRFGITNCFESIGIACSGDDIDVESYTDEQIRSKFLRFINNNLGVDDPSTFTGALMLDMEHPVHGRHLKNYLDNDIAFAKIVHEWGRRIAIAREVAPNADIGFYGIITPNLGGDWDGSVQAAIHAGELGLYQNLNHMVVVLYSRHGVDDGNAYERSARVIAERGLSLAEILIRIQG